MTDVVAAITNSIVALVALIALVVAGRHVREARKARLLAPYFEMDRRLHEQREERRLLYSATDVKTELWRQAFERVSATFDVLGALVREDMIYEPILFAIYYDVIIKTWDVVKADVETARNTGTRAQTYMRDFESLYERAKQYAKENGLAYPKVQPLS